jgi:hypothetical protein
MNIQLPNEEWKLPAFASDTAGSPLACSIIYGAPQLTPASYVGTLSTRMDDLSAPGPERTDIAAVRAELTTPPPSKKRRAAEKFLMAALGAIPWVGGFLSAAASIKDDVAGERRDDLQTQWLDEHQKKINDLGGTLNHIEDRFGKLGDTIDERIQTEEYLGLVRQAFRAWDEADTEEKRRYATNLIVNAAGTRVCSDDVVRLFLDWLELYHEVHFAVIREIYKNPGSTRFEMWTALYGDTLPREDSPEADLFRLMIRDLSTGGVVRQARDTNEVGQFVRRRPQRTGRPAQSTMESAFEDSKPYVLTALGKQFVHYTMNEVVTRVGSGPAPQAGE